MKRSHQKTSHRVIQKTSFNTLCVEVFVHIINVEIKLMIIYMTFLKNYAILFFFKMISEMTKIVMTHLQQLVCHNI